MLGPIHRLMARFLSISGKAWNKKQLALAANGQPRSWRILEAADGSDVNSCMRSLLSTALEPIKVAKQTLVACCHRLQRFAMASAGVCGLHSYLRMPRQGLPYQMFTLLRDASQESVDSLLQRPSCVRDELSHVLMRRYGQQVNQAEALAVLEGLADLISIDVANIESGHSTAREFAQLRSRGWTASLESICSRFILQQRQRVLEKADAEKSSKKETTKKRRGGGGAWRAFEHAYLRGRKLTAALAADMSAAYKELSPEERQVYEASGEAAARAHRMGLPSFAPFRSLSDAGPRRSQGQLLPGDQVANGAMVAVDVEGDLLAMGEYTGDTFAEKYCKYKAEVSQRLRAEARGDALAPTPEEQMALARFEAEAPTFVAAAQWERDGHEDLAAAVTALPPDTRSTTHHYSWCPPVERIVRATGFPSVFGSAVLVSAVVLLRVHIYVLYSFYGCLAFGCFKVPFSRR